MQERPRKATARWQVWVPTEVFFVATKLSGSMPRQDLVLAGCSWVVAMVSPCRDRGSLIATETVDPQK